MIPGKHYFLHSVKTQEQGTSVGPRRRNPPKKNPPGTGHTSDRLGCLAIFLRQRVKTFDQDFDQLHRFANHLHFNNHRSAGPMARRLTTNQEIAGSIPASIKNIIHHMDYNTFAFHVLFGKYPFARHLLYGVYGRTVCCTTDPSRTSMP
jgi:hypothetical protein